VPPVGAEVAEPSHAPEQDTLLITEAFAATAEG